MTRPLVRKVFAAATAGYVGMAAAIVSAGSASAYQPSLSNMYVAENAATCNKRPCVPYDNKRPGSRRPRGWLQDYVVDWWPVRSASVRNVRARWAGS